MSALSKFGKPLPPPRLDDYYEGADLSPSSESEEKPPPRSRFCLPSRSLCDQDFVNQGTPQRAF